MAEREKKMQQKTFNVLYRRQNKNKYRCTSKIKKHFISANRWCIYIYIRSRRSLNKVLIAFWIDRRYYAYRHIYYTLQLCAYKYYYIIFGPTEAVSHLTIPPRVHVIQYVTVNILIKSFASSIQKRYSSGHVNQYFTSKRPGLGTYCTRFIDSGD